MIKVNLVEGTTNTFVVEETWAEKVHKELIKMLKKWERADVKKPQIGFALGFAIKAVEEKLERDAVTFIKALERELAGMMLEKCKVQVEKAGLIDMSYVPIAARDILDLSADKETSVETPFISPSEASDATGWSKEYVIKKAPDIIGAFKNRSGWQIPIAWIEWNKK